MHRSRTTRSYPQIIGRCSYPCLTPTRALTGPLRDAGDVLKSRTMACLLRVLPERHLAEIEQAVLKWLNCYAGSSIGVHKSRAWMLALPRWRPRSAVCAPSVTSMDLGDLLH
jgi:hypothetical protein